MVKNDKFIFVHMPKAAGTTIERILMEHCPGSILTGDWKRHHPIHIFPDKGKVAKFKFGVIRDPFEYWVSWWNYDRKPFRQQNNIGVSTMFQDGEEDDFLKFVRNVSRRRDEVGKQLLNFKMMDKLDCGIFTWRFLYLFCNHDVFEDPYWEDNFINYLEVDWLLRCEALNLELRYMFRNHRDVFGLGESQARDIIESSPRHNDGGHAPHWQYYDDQARDIVRHKERAIIEEFYK